MVYYIMCVNTALLEDYINKNNSVFQQDNAYVLHKLRDK